MPRHATHLIKSHAGGVNRALTPELLNATELQSAENARDWIHGEARKRSGTQRIHTNQLGGGAPTLGLFQWDSPAMGKQVVAVSDGKFYHKTAGASTFTEVNAGLSTSVPTDFVVHRQDGDPVLYLADGTKYMAWDGGSLRLVSGSPTMRQLAVYNSRVFGIDDDKFLDWSAVDFPERWLIVQGAGMGAVETYDTESLRGLLVVGSSLLLWKENSISRFSGYDRYTIIIATETQGVSPEIGLIGGTPVLVEGTGFFISDRGAYLASESAVKSIGDHIRPVWDFSDREEWTNLATAHNRRRKEVWVFIPGGAGSSTNDTGWVYNYAMRTWWGPWTMPYGISAACRYERPSGQESVLLGGHDGWVRDGDVDGVGALDDVSLDGSGGTPITMKLTYAPALFDTPHRTKLGGPPWHIRADLKGEGELAIRTENEQGRNWTMYCPTVGPGSRDYRVRPAFRGKQLTVTLTDSSPSIVEVHSVLIEVLLGRATGGGW